MILVVGATGSVGGAVTRMLLAQGRAVRILTRAHSNYQPLVDMGAELYLGDVKQRDSLETACAGAQVVITTASSAMRGGEDNPESVDLDGNRNLIAAAKAAGVNQFIFVSASIASPDSPVPLFRAKGKAEEYLRQSGLSYTIIAPHAYMEMLLGMAIGMPALMGQPVTIVGEGCRRHSFVSVGDVVAFINAAIENPAAIDQRLLIGGPEPLTFQDAIAVYARVLGRQIPVRRVAPGEPAPGLPDALVEVLAGLERYDFPIDMTETARTFGVSLTPLEEVVRRTSASPQATFERMIQALNRHDLDGLVACFAPDLRSQQPFYPQRSFTGQAGVRKNWSHFFATVPNIQADILNIVTNGDTVWSELRFHGTRLDGTKHDVRGVTVQGIQAGQIRWVRLYVEDVHEPDLD